MGAIDSFRTAVLTRATRRNIPEDGINHSLRRENLKSYIHSSTYSSLNETHGVEGVLMRLLSLNTPSVNNHLKGRRVSALPGHDLGNKLHSRVCKPLTRHATSDRVLKFGSKFVDILCPHCMLMWQRE
jgi:hypothetical protein